MKAKGVCNEADRGAQLSGAAIHGMRAASSEDSGREVAGTGHRFNEALVDGAMLPPMAVILSLEEVIAGIRHALDIRLGRSQLVTTSPCRIAKGSAPRTSGRAACCHSCQALLVDRPLIGWPERSLSPTALLTLIALRALAAVSASLWLSAPAFMQAAAVPG
jgi:hypothetical protein